MNWKASATDWMKSSSRMAVILFSFGQRHASQSARSRSRKRCKTPLILLRFARRSRLEPELGENRFVVLADARNGTHARVETVAHPRRFQRRNGARRRVD